MTALEEAQAYLEKRKAGATPDVRTLSDEELIRHLPDDALLQHLAATQTVEAPSRNSSWVPPWIQHGQLTPLTPPLTDYPATAASFANQALLGIPKAIYEGQPAPLNSPTGARLSNYGYAPQPNPRQYPEPQSWQGKLAAAAGMAVPFGLAEQGMNLATRAVPTVAKMAATHPVMTRGVVGAAAGVLSNLPKPQEYAERAAVMAAGNMVIPPLIEKLVNKIPPGKILTDPEMAKFAGKVRQALFGSKMAEGVVFDQTIASSLAKNPNQISPAIDLVNEIEAAMQDEASGLAGKIHQGMVRVGNQGNTTLQDFLKNRNLAMNATAQQVQDIKETLQAIPSVNRALNRLSNVKWQANRFDASVSDADLEAMHLINSARENLLSAYSEAQDAYNRFSSFMEDYRMIRPNFKPSSMETTILKGLGNAEARQAMGRVMPSEILKEIESVRTAHAGAMTQAQKSAEFKKLLKTLGWSVGGAVTGWNLKNKMP